MYCRWRAVGRDVSGMKRVGCRGKMKGRMGKARKNGRTQTSSIPLTTPFNLGLSISSPVRILTTLPITHRGGRLQPSPIALWSSNIPLERRVRFWRMVTTTLRVKIIVLHGLYKRHFQESFFTKSYMSSRHVLGFYDLSFIVKRSIAAQEAQNTCRMKCLVVDVWLIDEHIA